VSIVVDIQTISIAIASAGVFAAAIYYILQLKHQSKSRRIDSYWRILSTFNTREYLEAIFEVWSLDFKDYSDFTSKYGTPLSRENSTWVSISMVCDLFEGAAYLCRNGLMDYNTVKQIPVRTTWEKVKTIAEGARKQLGLSGMWIDFEWLYNEMQMRQQLQQTGAKNG
jgi:hypothetical protein